MQIIQNALGKHLIKINILFTRKIVIISLVKSQITFYHLIFLKPTAIKYYVSTKLQQLSRDDIVLAVVQ